MASECLINVSHVAEGADRRRLHATVPFSLWSSPEQDRHIFRLIEWLSGIGVPDTIRELKARTDLVQRMHGYTDVQAAPSRRHYSLLPTQFQSCPTRIDDPAPASSASSHQPSASLPIPDDPGRGMVSTVDQRGERPAVRPPAGRWRAHIFGPADEAADLCGT